MKYLHRAFREALADESNCSFEDGVLHIRDLYWTTNELLELIAKNDGSENTFEHLFQNWMTEWKEQKRDEADEIIKLYKQHDRFKRIVDVYKQGTLAPFVGAGLSIPSGYPGWCDFLRKIREKSLVPEAKFEAFLADGKLEEAAQCLADDRGPGFAEHLRNCFTPQNTVCGAVGLLPYIFSGPVYTTNFDTVLERVFKDAGKDFESTMTGTDAEDLLASRLDFPHYLLKLHGEIKRPKSWVLTLTEYEAHYAEKSAINHAVQIIYDTNYLLFLGCSLQADRWLKAFRTHVIQKQGATPLDHYAFLASPESEERRLRRERELADYHIYPIWYPPDAHDESITALLIKLHEDAQ